MTTSPSLTDSPPAPAPTPPGAPGAPDVAHGRPRGSDPLARSVARSARHPWAVLVAGLVLVIAAASGLALGMRTISDADSSVGGTAEANRLLAGADLGEAATETLVLTAASGGAPAPADVDAFVTDLRTELAGAEDVEGVADPVAAPDGSLAVVPVVLRQAPAVDAADDTAAARARGAEQVARAREAVAARFPDLDVGQFGEASIEADVERLVGEDFRRAELIALPITLVILLVAFGSGVAALIPVAVGMSAVVSALGLTALVSQVMPVDRNAQSLILLIGLAVGVDYALFVIRRTREERAAGASPRGAVVATGTTAVRAVVVSGVTVVVAMSGLVMAGGMFTSLGIGTALVVLAAVVLSATVLPAVLALLGDRVDAVRMPWRRGRASTRTGLWEALARRVVARPLVWGGLAALVLVALAAPAAGMRTAIGGIQSLPQGLATVQAYERVQAVFPADADEVHLVVRTPDAADSAAVTARLESAGRDAVAAGAATGTPEPVASADGLVHVLQLAVPVPAAGAPADAAYDSDEAAVALIRSEVVPALVDRLAADGVEARVGVGGDVADRVDFTDWLDQRLPVVVAFVLVLTLVVMAVSFGSLTLSAATVGLNLLSVGAAYGVLTLVFQYSWAEGLLGFTSTGAVASWLPLMLFVVLFGLSMDYHVFVVSRVREARLAGLAAGDAVVAGVTRSAGVVTSAAVIMVGVFSVFATLSLLEMKQMGVGLAAAVLVDATVVRGVLLPAVLARLGDRAHTGPRWLPALHG